VKTAIAVIVVAAVVAYAVWESPMVRRLRAERSLRKGRDRDAS